jgi:O-antigen ligase
MNARVIHLTWLAILLIFAPLFDGGTTHVAVMIIRFLIIGLAGSCLWTIARQGQIRSVQFHLWWPVLAFLVWSALSMFMSPTIHQSRQWFVILLLYAVLLYFIVFSLTRWNDVIKVVSLLSLLGLAESVYGLVQTGMLKHLRPSGTFFNPNFLAGYLVAISSMLMGVGLFAKKGGRFTGTLGRLRRLPWGWTVAMSSIALCLLAATITTGSRGALVGLLAGMVFLLVARYRWRGLTIVMCFTLALLIVPNSFSLRLQTEHAVNPVTYARINMWKQAIQIILDHPLGVGIGLYQYVYPERAFAVDGEIARYGKIAQTPHSEFLQIGAELGVPGLLLFVVGLAAVARETFAGLRTRMTRFHRGLAIGLAASTVSLLAHAGVDSNLHEPAIALLLTFNVAVLCSLRSFSIRNEVLAPGGSRAVHPAWAIGGAVCLAWLGAFAAQTGVAWLYFEQGTVAQREGDVAGALDSYRTAIRLDSDKALYHSSLAAARFQQFRQTHQASDAQGAIDELLAAIARNPIDGRLHGLLGHLYTALADFLPPTADAMGQTVLLRRKAIEAYEQARSLEPFSPMHRLQLGRLYWVMGDRQRGLEEVLHATQIEPNFLPARAWLVKAYLTSHKEADRLHAQQQLNEIVGRQHQYAAVAKNELETMYLAVDVSELKATIEQPEGSS